MTTNLLVRLVAAAAVLTLAACGSSGSAAPAPTARVTPTLRPVPTRGQETVHTYHIPGMKTPAPGQTFPAAGTSRVPRAPLPTIPPVPTFTPIPAAAYTASIHGTVVDRKTGSPIPGALVTVGSGAVAGHTSSYGTYRLRFPANVGVPVSVSAAGYIGALSMGRLRPHQAVKVDFKLARVAAGVPAAPPPPSVFGQP